MKKLIMFIVSLVIIGGFISCEQDVLEDVGNNNVEDGRVIPDVQGVQEIITPMSEGIVPGVNDKELISKISKPSSEKGTVYAYTDDWILVAQEAGPDDSETVCENFVDWTAKKILKNVAKNYYVKNYLLEATKKNFTSYVAGTAGMIYTVYNMVVQSAGTTWGFEFIMVDENTGNSESTEGLFDDTSENGWFESSVQMVRGDEEPAAWFIVFYEYDKKEDTYSTLKTAYIPIELYNDAKVIPHQGTATLLWDADMYAKSDSEYVNRYRYSYNIDVWFYGWDNAWHFWDTKSIVVR